MNFASLSILIYHRVLARPDPLFPGEVHARQFEQQLKLLKRFFTPLPLPLALQRLQDGTLPARAACVTFDDGYADNAQVALPLLQKHGLHATFFIASGYMDGGQMWNDKLIDTVRHAPGPSLDLRPWGLNCWPLARLEQRQAAIADLLGKLKYLPFDERESLASQIASSGHASHLMLSLAQLRQLHQAGMQIGAHTVHHPILSALPDQHARQEIADGKAQLEQWLQTPLTLFAYPNGKRDRDYGPCHVEMVKALGFTAAVATDWGVSRPGAGLDLFQLARFTPWDRGRLAFLWRLQQNMRQMPPGAN